MGEREASQTRAPITTAERLRRSLSLPAFAEALPFALAALTFSAFAVLSFLELHSHVWWKMGCILGVDFALLYVAYLSHQVSSRGPQIRLAAYLWAMLFFVLLALATNVVPASLSLALNLVLLLIYDLLTAPRLVFRLARSVARRRRLILTLCYLFYFLVLLNVMVDHSLLGQFAPGREANAPRWVPRANAYYGINRQGFRGPEIELTDLRSFPRLLFLGDSSTFGLGVKADQAFPAVLERMLHQVGLLDARSLNAGVNGYDTFGLIYRYREFAAWKPNYVFIMDGIHFESPNTTSSRYFLPYVAPLRGLYWLTTLLQPRLALTSAAEKNDAYRRWMETLGKLVKEAKRGGGIVALISYPSDVIEGKVYYTVQAQARNAQVHYLGAYEAFGAQRKKLLWIDNVHPNQAGHHLLACLVAGWVAQQERSTVRLPECATLWGPPPTRP